MIAYLDASVALRLVLGEPKPLAGWSQVTAAVASALTQVECLRTLDRLHRAGALGAEELANRRTAVYRLLEAVELVEVAPSILRRASETFPTPLGTLDAIHLSTALAWRDLREPALVLATHDQSLATAARSLGFEVTGA